jgi:hypothetical protein
MRRPERMSIAYGSEIPSIEAMTDRVADPTVADETSEFNLQLWQQCEI